MPRIFRLPLLVSCTVFILFILPAFAQRLVFEAEDCSTPVDAWSKDHSSSNKWNLWTTDKDADKKWSGGKVLQSPQVMTDRGNPEDGAPVLHTVLAAIPKGKWTITIKYGRDLGVSLDGREWKRLSELNGQLGRFDISDGKFEFWVDDRYAAKKGAGSSYYDCITLTPVIPEKNGIANGNFEFSKELADSGWSFQFRDGNGSAELTDEGHPGRCAKLKYDSTNDWTFNNIGRLDVQPNQVWKATAWIKCQDTKKVSLCIAGWSTGKITERDLAYNSTSGTRRWKRIEATAIVPAACDQISVGILGNGKAIVWVDEITLQAGPPAAAPKPKEKVTGWATTRMDEKLGRGMLALPSENGKAYLGWRLLKNDPADIAFNVYRGTGKEQPVKLNDKPISSTTDFIDDKMPTGTDNAYWVRPVVNGTEQEPSEQVLVKANSEVKPYISFKLQGDHTFQKVGIGDLDGDGQLDYVIKQPSDNIDPAASYWTPSPDTYKLEAYRSDGTLLWRKDLGWGIERGIWYSPYLVYDFDGDGKAEVAVKTSKGDPRDPDGRVTSGPEYLSILNGATGREKVRIDWPDRREFGCNQSSYNLSSRNQLGIAYLDGKTPCLLVARGTYIFMEVIAYQYHNKKLTELWRWNNREEAFNYRGQGAHWMHSGDVDNDGRDEVILGSSVIDDDGKGLWSTGLGHPDCCFLGDLDPSRPGLEIFYNIEPGHKENGVCLVDARTGEIIWGLKEQTFHVGSGVASDIDATLPGCECWAAEDGKGDPKKEKYNGNPPKWMFSIKGEILAREKQVPPFRALYWDADSQRELIRGGQITKYGSKNILTKGIEGSQSFWADIIGDWREELVTSVKGELRIYTTTIPATDRRICLLQDPIYRHDVAHLAMGYPQIPTHGTFITQTNSSASTK